MRLALSKPPAKTSTMSLHDEERRYSEEEFGLVLRIASEVDAEAKVEKGPVVGRGREDGAGRGPPPPREGLTLDQIREIAAEVGIDPERVSRAAGFLPLEGESAGVKLLGGQPRHRLEYTVSGVIPEKELGRIIDEARRALSIQGETREVLGGLEWKGSTSTSSVMVSVTPREGETVLQASNDRTEALAGFYGGVGIPVAGIIAVTLGKLVFGETDAGIIAALFSGFLPGVLVARTLWKGSTRRWKDRLFNLMDAMAREGEAAVERGEQGGQDGGRVPEENKGVDRDS